MVILRTDGIRRAANGPYGMLTGRRLVPIIKNSDSVLADREGLIFRQPLKVRLGDQPQAR